MFNQPNIPYQNALLRRLSPGDLASIEPNLERVALPMRTQLESTKSVIEHVYFLEDGIASVVAKLPKGRDTEVGLIGMEGTTGALVALGGDRAAHDTYMQLAGSGLRVPAPALSSALSESTTLKAVLLLYVQTLYSDQLHRPGKRTVEVGRTFGSLASDVPRSRPHRPACNHPRIHIRHARCAATGCHGCNPGA